MDVICLGILVADVFVSPVDSLPDAGELKTTDRFLLSAANTVIDLRRLNRRVAVSGKVGEDLFGVRDRRVRAARHRHFECQTEPHAAHLQHGHPERSRRRPPVPSLRWRECRVVPGRRGLLLPRGFPRSLRGRLSCMPGFSADDLAGLFQAAKKKSITTVLDVVIPAGLSVSLSQIAKVLPYADYFLPNQDEASLLTGEDDAAEQANAWPV